jgi:hypothetical protein
VYTWALAVRTGLLLNKQILWQDWQERVADEGEAGPVIHHCAVAAKTFYCMAGGADAGWRLRCIPKAAWAHGPYYYVEHPASGKIVNVSAETPVRDIPFEKAVPVEFKDTESVRAAVLKLSSDEDRAMTWEPAARWAYQQSADMDFDTSKPEPLPIIAAPVAEEHVAEAAAEKERTVQGQRAIDKAIRQFLKEIKAPDIRIRRIGHTTYTWLHELDITPGDTGSDLRWEIRHVGNQIHMGIFDIKPFFRVLQGPFDVKKLKDARKNILDEMDADADGLRP